METDVPMLERGALTERFSVVLDKEMKSELAELKLLRVRVQVLVRRAIKVAIKDAKRKLKLA